MGKRNNITSYVLYQMWPWNYSVEAVFKRFWEETLAGELGKKTWIWNMTKTAKGFLYFPSVVPKLEAI